MITVYPEEGNFPFIARALLDAAEHPSQVRSVSHPRAGFEVPADVFDRFVAAQPDVETGQPQPDTPVGESRKRRGGRTRKEPLLTPEELAAAIAEGTPDSDASKEE